MSFECRSSTQIHGTKRRRPSFVYCFIRLQQNQERHGQIYSRLYCTVRRGACRMSPRAVPRAAARAALERLPIASMSFAGFLASGICTFSGSSVTGLSKTRSQTDLVNALLMETRKDAKGAVAPVGKTDMGTIPMSRVSAESTWAWTHVSLWRVVVSRVADQRDLRLK